MPLNDGEIPGVRRSLDKLVEQESRARPNVHPDKIRRELVDCVVKPYVDRVERGTEPPPKRRD